MIRALSLFSILFVAACGGSKAGGGDTMANPCAGDPCGAGMHDPCGGDPCGGSAMASFDDWQSFTKVSDSAFLSKGHGKKYVDVYVESSIVDRFSSGGSAPYPVGARIVKAQYKSQAAQTVESLTVMKKMEAGYDPDNGDWYYGVFGPDGKTAMNEGKIDMCINCHDQASDNDYVFGNVE